MIAINLPRKGLKLAHINICSLRNKITEVGELLSLGIHLLAISETHLDDTFNDEVLGVQGYNIFRRDRNRFGGGIAVYVQNNIPVKVRMDLMVDDIEVIWLQINLPYVKPLLIGCVYRPPSAPMDYLDQLCLMLDKVCDLGHETYFLGDTNIDWNSCNCTLKEKLQSTARACNLSQMVEKPTRVCIRRDGSKSETCIDHIFTNCSHLCSKALSIPVGCSDHNLVVMVRKAKLPKSGPKIVYRRSMKNFNEVEFIESVKNTCWRGVLEQDNPDDALDNFNTLFLHNIELYAPMRKNTVRNFKSPWLDTELRESMRSRDKAKQAAMISGSESDWQVYKKLRNYVTAQNKRKKQLFYENKIKSVKSDKKKMWNVVNDMMGRNPKSCPSYLEVDGTFLTKPVDIANYFNDYYYYKINSLRSNMQDTRIHVANTLIGKFMENKNCKFKLEKVTVNEVECLLNKCKDRPPGVDNLDVKFISMVANLIAEPVCHIINLSIEKSICPKAWKIAKIIPLTKNSAAPFSGTNSRPISLLPALAKVMERIVFQQIQLYFDENGLNSEYQHAYRPCHSTCTALTQMTDDWQCEIDKGRMVGAVLLDFSAAFDLIDYFLLSEKLKQYGFSGSALTWMESYLSNRKQTVFFNGSLSKVSDVNCGVPQGSCLGPLLFSIFINDLPLSLHKAQISIYADDSTIYATGSTIEEINIILDYELKSVIEWIKNNKLVLNVGKTKSILFGSKHNVGVEPKLDLNINNIPIEQVQETKLLGITLTHTLSWSHQVDKVVSKMGRAVSVTRRISKGLPTDVIRQVLNALVLSQLDYCFVIWSSASMNDMKKLQIVQNKAARCALNCSYRTNVKDMHDSLGWLTVSQRSTYFLLNFIRNIKCTQSPIILYKSLLKNCAQHEYQTRHVTDGRFNFPTVKTATIQKTVMYRSIVRWNDLPSYIIQSNSKEAFKRMVKQHLRIFHDTD